MYVCICIYLSRHRHGGPIHRAVLRQRLLPRRFQQKVLLLLHVFRYLGWAPQRGPFLAQYARERFRDGGRLHFVVTRGLVLTPGPLHLCRAPTWPLCF